MQQVIVLADKNDKWLREERRSRTIFNINLLPAISIFQIFSSNAKLFEFIVEVWPCCARTCGCTGLPVTQRQMREGRGGRCSSRREFNEREVRLTNSLITEPCHSDWARALTLSEHRKVMLRAGDHRIGLLNGNRICFQLKPFYFLAVLFPNKQNTWFQKKKSFYSRFLNVFVIKQ